MRSNPLPLNTFKFRRRGAETRPASNCAGEACREDTASLDRASSSSRSREITFMNHRSVLRTESTGSFCSRPCGCNPQRDPDSATGTQYRFEARDSSARAVGCARISIFVHHRPRHCARILRNVVSYLPRGIQHGAGIEVVRRKSTSQVVHGIEARRVTRHVKG